MWLKHLADPFSEVLNGETVTNTPFSAPRIREKRFVVFVRIPPMWN